MLPTIQNVFYATERRINIQHFDLYQDPLQGEEGVVAVINNKQSAWMCGSHRIWKMYCSLQKDNATTKHIRKHFSLYAEFLPEEPMATTAKSNTSPGRT
jgi:hypothetical protein